MTHHLVRSLAAVLLLTAGALVAQDKPAPAIKKGLTAKQAASADAFARSYVEAIIGGDLAACSAAWDLDGMIALVTKGVDAPERRLKDFRVGMKKGLEQVIPQLCQHWQSGDCSFKSVVVIDGVPMARLRSVGDDGIGFIDFVMHQKQGKWRIINLNNRSVGLDMAEQMRMTSLAALASLDRGFVKRLFGSGVTSKDLKDLASLGQDSMRGEFEKVLTTYRKLPKSLRNTALATASYVSALAQVGSDEDYTKALDDAVARFPAPMFRFMQVDAHFLKKRWNKAVKVLDEFAMTIGRDATLLALRASILSESGQVPKAIATLKDAIKLEPRCHYVHVTALDVLLKGEDWAGVAHSVTVLEKDHGYEFRGAMTDPVWAGFLKVPESKPWR